VFIDSANYAYVGNQPLPSLESRERKKKPSENTSLEIDALVTDPTRALLNLLQFLLRIRSNIFLLRKVMDIQSTYDDFIRSN